MKIVPGANNSWERRLLTGLDTFLGLTAAAGGIALLTRLLAPPVELLRNSPFTSYEVPGLTLLVVVGGGALMAATAMVIDRPFGRLASLLAGLAIVGFEVVEMLAVSEGSWLQYFYLAVGAAIVGLALRQPGAESP